LPAATDGAGPSARDGALQDDAPPPIRADAAVDPACVGVTCALANDCCMCQAYDNTVPPPMPPCAAICEAPMCEALGIAGATPYCFRGECFITAQAGTCSADADCQVVNDCCRCSALPRAAAQTVGMSCAADCFQGRCSALGLIGVGARCVAGSCRLALP